jgi:hypothetical protein
MLDVRQVVVLVAFAIVFWIAATAWIHFCPGFLVDPLKGGLGFLTSVPVCWLCILIVRLAAGLLREQLVAGTAVVVAVATLIDAVAMRWAPGVYADSDLVCRVGAAWLLWGYGLSLGIALLMQNGRPAPRLT